jgi:hypothetical protein
MIYVTGDIHGDIDIRKLSSKNFIQQKLMTKEDYLIIAGDFGLIWYNHPISKCDKYWLNWLNNKNFTTLWIDGNHECFDYIEEYEVKEWHGGKVQFIRDNVIHLMRGQVFDIDNKRIFTMGGGESIDKKFRIEGKSWWPQELPSMAEYKEAHYNIDKFNWNVDFVITHTCSSIMQDKMAYYKENNALNDFFDILENNLTFKHWYFGHFHYDFKVDDKHTAVYTKFLKLD